MTNLAAPHMDLDESHARFRAQLFQWREVHAAAHIYALLDPNHPVAPHDQLHPSGLTKREVTRHIESVVRPDLAHELALLPKLVQLYVAGESGYADEPMLDLTLRSAATRCRSVNGAYVAGWMCSEASPATAAEYLARSGTMFDLSKGRQRYLPIFEPYRMALLADDPQAESFLQRWLGPFIHWMFIDSCGTVRTVSRHADSTTSGGAAGLDRTLFEAQERIKQLR